MEVLYTIGGMFLFILFMLLVIVLVVREVGKANEKLREDFKERHKNFLREGFPD